ncbi:uncharacterized protein [Periplaneta americana]|uniref:uncharacterized protein isoform X1 n=1 Tax=Periplaneta americana TaxID=6978 RepID=UPI0037E86CBB
MDASSCRKWVRPASVPFPTVWRRSTGRTKMEDGKIPNFRIQDLPEELEEELLDLMCNIFVRDEQISARCKMCEDPVSVQESREAWRKAINQKMTLVAIVDEDGAAKPRIAGANILGVTLKSDPPNDENKYKGKAVRETWKFINWALEPVDVFKTYGVDEYMSALGLLVVPEFRGQGLSVELLKARFPLAKAVGLKATMTFFSPAAAQAASLKAGMELLHEVLYEDYKKDGEVVFPNMKNKAFRVMGARIT